MAAAASARRRMWRHRRKLLLLLHDGKDPIVKKRHLETATRGYFCGGPAITFLMNSATTTYQRNPTCQVTPVKSAVQHLRVFLEKEKGNTQRSESCITRLLGYYTVSVSGSTCCMCEHNSYGASLMWRKHASVIFVGQSLIISLRHSDYHINHHHYHELWQV